MEDRRSECGNYATKNEEEELCAGGSDSISLRVALQKAASAGWDGATCDIKTAFLNAPLLQGDTDGQESTVLIAPPCLLSKLGYAKEARAWGIHRDLVFEDMEWDDGDRTLRFKMMDSDPNVWKLVEADSEEMVQLGEGLMLVYVDDLLILGPASLVRSCLERIA